MSLRLRVTLAFTAMMAVVLVALGGVVYLRERHSLNESIDNGLRARADAVTAPSAHLIETDETVAQLLSPTGQGEAAHRPALIHARTVHGPTTFQLPRVAPLEAEVRLFAAPTHGKVVVVGQSLGDRNEALHKLVRFLLIGGPVGLLLAALAGSWAI